MADQSSRAGVRYDTPEIIAYADGVYAPHDEALRRTFAAPKREGLPQIMVLPSEAKLHSVCIPTPDGMAVGTKR
jgi:hypothetical protein